MLTGILLILLGAVVGGLFAHSSGYKTGWDDGYKTGWDDGYETAARFYTLR